MKKTPNRLSGQSKSISIVAGGVLDKRFLPEITSAAIVIGVDRGAFWLIKQGSVPNIAIGDFDSVTHREKKYIHDRVPVYIEFSIEKDATDLELAIEEAVRHKPTVVRIFGALGSRSDHSLAAVNLLWNLVSHNIHGEIVDNFNKIHIVRHLEKFSRSEAYPYLSVIPFGSDAIVTLKGFRYDVSKKKFIRGSTLGISNEIAGNSATVAVHRGSVIVIQSSDRPVRS